MEILKNKYKFDLPSEILQEFQDGNEKIQDTTNEVNGFLEELGSTKGSLSKPKSKKEENADKIDMIDKEIDLLRQYKARIKIIPEGRKTVGEGIRNYKQPKRNAIAMLLSIGCQKYLRTFLSFLFFLDQ